MVAPHHGDHREAEQERRVVAVVALDRSPERRDGAPCGHRQVDGQQRDGDGGDGVGKERQPVNGTRFVLHRSLGHQLIIS
jgi:hypothetical protein